MERNDLSSPLNQFEIAERDYTVKSFLSVSAYTLCNLYNTKHGESRARVCVCVENVLYFARQKQRLLRACYASREI